MKHFLVLKPNMEMPEQELPAIFSQMLQMFPNIPREIIWVYVQQYSRDIEKCAQILNLQNSKYAGLRSTSDASMNLNECNYNILQVPHFVLQPELTENNNSVPLCKQLPLQGTESVIQKWHINDKPQTEKVTFNSPLQSPTNALHENSPADSPKNVRDLKYINFNEPLRLDIVPDDDDISHSWRPNVSADALCSDFFAPSPMSENLNSNLVPSFNFERNTSEILMNPEGRGQESSRFSNPMHMLYSFNQPSKSQDISSYLHYQKSQMNVMRYEVIKAKIDLNSLKEDVEKLAFELREKMQSKSVHDIEELNEEIVQLRVECQCLCTNVDHLLNDDGLLGEVDERCYEEKESSSNSAAAPSPQCANAHRENHTDVLDDSNRWQCPKCTFANHSAISVCEMCSTAKPSKQSPPFLHAASGPCYCHPKENSLSVES